MTLAKIDLSFWVWADLSERDSWKVEDEERLLFEQRVSSHHVS